MRYVIGGGWGTIELLPDIRLAAETYANGECSSRTSIWELDRCIEETDGRLVWKDPEVQKSCTEYST